MASSKHPACCISHLFHATASKNPDKIAVIHASGFAGIARRFRRDAEFAFLETTLSSRPPVYDGDECFSFSDILSAVENLSCRLRRILDGAHDPGLIIPCSEDVQSSGFLPYSSPNIQQSTSFINTYTPKVIGIYMEPSVEYIVAILSVLRCGEAFMPLDPAWPKSRIISVISSSKAKLVIGYKSLMQEDYCHKLDKLQWLIDNGSFPVLPISMKENQREQYHPPLAAWPCESECLRSFCYLMYTSGSSGKPKGVCGTEIGLLNRFLWMQDLYPVEEGDLVLFKTQISFIDHLPEFLGAILANCTLVTPPFNQLKENILYVIDFLQGYFINKLVAVPSLIRAILPDLQSPRYVMVRNSLKLLILSGEVFHVSLCEMLMKLLPQTSILNLYGSTEVTGDCTYFDCKRLALVMQNQVLASIPIGLPLSNCDVVLVGEDAPIEGEIYVGGQCVAAGYYKYPYIMPLEQMELPLHCDVQCPGDGYRTQPFFKTGDFARKLPSGDLVFLGRKDRTIKVNGQRVALEEIEGAFRDHPDVVDAAVISHDVDGEILLLEAYLLLKQMIEETEELKHSLRSWMMSKLPQMMIPSSILFSRSLPLTSSGKVDYSSLAASTHSVIRIKNTVEEVPPVDLIDVIQKVFSDALMVEKIAVDDNFFDMGGNSMSAAYASFKLGIHMKLLYTFPTPLKLQMALLSSNDALRINADSGLGLSELHGDMLLSNYRVSGYPGSKPRARLLWSDSDGDSDNPSKHLKATKEGSPSDDDFWNLNPPVHTSCSFSRCNKGSHGGNREGNCLCYLYWSNMLLKDRKGFLQELWKACIDSCVDASPLVVFLGNDVRLFIGSHSHKFVCLDAKSGNLCWETKLQGRVECSAEILDDFSQVVVGCYEGKIYFLDYLNGSICWKFQTSGEVKSQPLVDKCSHLVWCGSYDHNLYALDYKSYQCIYKLQCGGSIFGSPAIDEMQRKLFVAATSGHVTALTVQALPFKKLWKQDLGAPIFGSLSIISSNGNVICCLVDGTVVVLDNNGSIIWKARTGGPIFAGPCISKALPSQVLVSSRDGSIYSFEMETGNLLWNHNIGHPISSSPCADEDLQLITDVSTMSERSGCIHVLRINLNALGYSNRNEKDVVHEFARLDLEGEIFSSPVMIGGRIFVGCRDDHVYCIKLDAGTDHVNSRSKVLPS
ncbi:putative acyl-activating enzyme 19 isoform X2 [Primulina huaijiensis]|uniref:putative acyl-activating enzyme 19 isoform X2 n=1 Tax=Primulina huaijiensis TaxID=1492673 RepID=UPI003CC6DFDE